MNGFKKALISIFALVLIALCALLLFVIAFVPSAALAKTLAIVLPLCIIAGAVIALWWPIRHAGQLTSCLAFFMMSSNDN